MDLTQFAKKAGVEIVECDAEVWGGAIGYKTADCPNATVCGFRTEEAARKHWLESAFGKKTGKAVLALLAPKEKEND